MSTVQLVLVLIAAVAVPLLVAGTVLTVVLKRKSRAAEAELGAELAAEPAALGPEKGIYRGSTGSYPKVVGNGTIALTERRILFRKTVGRGIDVPLSDVVGVSTAPTFNRSRVGGQTHLVVHTHHGDVAYFVSDMAVWVRAISQRAGSKA